MGGKRQIIFFLPPIPVSEGQEAFDLNHFFLHSFIISGIDVLKGGRGQWEDEEIENP